MTARTAAPRVPAIQKGRRTRKYSDRERAGALAVLTVNNGCAKATAEQLAMPRSTLRSWRDETPPGAAALVGGECEKLADVFEGIARRAAGLVSAEKLEEASAAQLTTVAAIATDKMLLLRGQGAGVQPEDRTQFEGVSTAELEVRITELRARLAAEPADGGQA